MKKSIKIVDQNQQIVYNGTVLNLPMKSTFIKLKCIELFNDDDPCIIHQSFAISKFADQFMAYFKSLNLEVIELERHINEIDFINLPNLAMCTLHFEGKK